jgi:hypothetical protein
MTKNKQTKADKPAKGDAKVVAELIAESVQIMQPAIPDAASNVVPLNAPTAPAPATAGDGEPPQSALHAKVVAFWGKLRDDLTTNAHNLAVECMLKASTDGDLRPLLAYQQAMPNSTRKLAFAAWCVAFGPIDWGKKDDKDNMTSIKKAGAGSKNQKDWNVAGCEAITFYDVKEAEKPKGIMDAVKQLISQNATYEKMLADPTGIVRKDGVTDEQLHAAIERNKRMIAASA